MPAPSCGAGALRVSWPSASTLTEGRARRSDHEQRHPETTKHHTQRLHPRQRAVTTVDLAAQRLRRLAPLRGAEGAAAGAGAALRLRLVGAALSVAMLLMMPVTSASAMSAPCRLTSLFSC